MRHPLFKIIGIVMPKYEQFAKFKNFFHKQFTKLSLGTHSNANAFEIKDNEVADSLNMIPKQEGLLASRGGYLPNNTTLGAYAVKAIGQFRTSNENKLLAVCNGSIYAKAYGDSAFGSALKTGLDTDHATIIQAFNKAYIATGVDRIQVRAESGSSTSDLTEDITDELLATGASGVTNFSGTLASPIVEAGSVVITDGTETFTDDGNGRLIGDLGGSGYCMDFNGTTDYVEIPQAGDLAGITSFSVACWFKKSTADLAGTANLLKLKSGTSYFVPWMLRFHSDDKLSFYVNDATGTSQYRQTAVLQDTDWHFVVCTFDTSNITISLDDGTPVTAATTIGAMKASTDPLYIGAVDRTGTPQDYFDGKIDQVRVFDKVLSAEEITALYEDDTVPSNCIGEWLFTEGTGSTVGDSSGSSNDGTTYGTPSWSADIVVTDVDTTIDYTSGAYDVTFATEPSVGVGIYADYTRYAPILDRLTFWKNRIWGSIGARLYYSASGGDEFTSTAGGGFLDIYANDGDDITGFGVLNDILYVFKGDKIASVEIMITETGTYMVSSTVRETIGSVAPKSVISSENNVYFLGRDDEGGFNIFSLGPEPNLLEVVKISNIGDRVKDKLDEINGTYADNACAHWANGAYRLCYPTGTYNDSAMLFSSTYMSLYPHEGYNANEVITFIDDDESERVLFADAAATGLVHEFNSSFSDNGVAIESYILTKRYHITEWIIAKLWRYIDCIFKNVTGTVEISIYTNENLRDTTDYAIGGELGTGGLGVDVLALTELGVTSGDTTQTTDMRTIRISRGLVGKDIQLKISKDTLNHGFEYLGHGFWFRTKSMKPFNPDYIYGGE